ncbi:MAG: 2-amino-4-hydroxy-6-hydroxymethyldihydropteridine diphosphokinase [Gaiellales bacterium]|nr:MAG: 2-amino-4-hydroxy-6-hydroxymethyldihydropteridine diphosphokinase [Gaiellales bacterium]
MSTAYLSLGCNAGDCRANLAQAVGLLADDPATEVVAVSSVYVTEPVGMKEQPDFFNIAVELETELEPLELLAACRSIEEALGGRDGRVPGGPRTMDIDIILYEQVKMMHKDLALPHPRMAERAFVMVPLAEIAPGRELVGGGTVEQRLASLDDPHRVTRDGVLEGFPGGKSG